jgi:glutamyl-tRNA synthetase
MVRPFLAEIGLGDVDQDKLARAIPTVRERARTLREAASSLAFYFRAPEFDEKAKKFLTSESATRLTELAAILAPVQPWDEANLERALTAWLTQQNLSMKDIAQPARVALTGRTVSPGLYEVLTVLGREESLGRLDCAIELCHA